MQTPAKSPGAVADAQRGNWVDRFAPDWLRPYARLARWDRPIGFWLLFWPCAFALALAAIAGQSAVFDWRALALMFIGAVAMRGAGCTFNDIVDAEIDGRVARTRSRPIPSGQVSRLNAAIFLMIQLLAGFLVLIQFNWTTIWLGIASLGLVAVYPFMKRVTWWPQLFLGLAFSWGAILGWTAQAGAPGWPSLVLYLGTILWVIGYDTIYAMQDVEDDAIIGVKSTARLFGARGRAAVSGFYAATLLLWLFAALAAGAGPIAIAGIALPAILMIWQLVTLDPASAENTLARFKSNHFVGLAFALVLIVDWVF